MIILKMIMAFGGIYAALYLCGYPLKVLLLPEDMEKYDLYMTPWLGVCLAVVVFYPLSLAGFSVERTADLFMYAVLAADLLLWLKYKKTIRAERGEIIILVSMGLVAAVFYALPLRGGGEDRAVYAFAPSFDFAQYLNYIKIALSRGARFLNEYRVGMPYYWWPRHCLINAPRAYVFVPAFFTALSGADVSAATYATNAFALFLGLAVFRLFLGRSARLSVLLPLALFLSVSAFYERFMIYVFIGQMYSFGAVLLIFYIQHYLSEREALEPRTCILAAFLIVANGWGYIESLYFPLVPVLPFAAAALFSGNKKGLKKACLQNAALTGALFCVFGFPLIVKTLKVILFWKSASVGFPVDFPTFADVSGIEGIFSSPGAFYAMLAASNVIFISAMLCQMRREGYASFLSLSCLAFLLLHLAVCLMFFRPGERISYNVQKSALSFSFVPVLLVLRFLSGAFSELAGPGSLRAKWRPVIMAAVFAVFFALNAGAYVRNFYAARKYVGPDDPRITSDNDIISRMAENPFYDDSDFILNTSRPVTYWTAVAYAPAGRTYTNDYAGVGSDENRHMKENVSSGDIYMAYPPYEADISTVRAPKIFENGTYAVFRLEGDSVVLYDYSGLSLRIVELVDFDGNRKTGRFVTDGPVVLKFASVSDTVSDISALFFDLREDASDLKIFVKFNGVPVGVFPPVRNECRISLPELRLKAGINELSFESEADLKDLVLAGLKIF
jgi:hypothetical protein